jgi:hypothetical protein
VVLRRVIEREEILPNGGLDYLESVAKLSESGAKRVVQRASALKTAIAQQEVRERQQFCSNRSQYEVSKTSLGRFLAESEVRLDGIRDSAANSLRNSLDVTDYTKLRELSQEVAKSLIILKPDYEALAQTEFINSQRLGQLLCGPSGSQ